MVTDNVKVVLLPNVTPWFHSLRKSESENVNGPGTRVPVTLPLGVAAPSVLSVVKPLTVAVLPCTVLPPTKSSTINPVWPLIGAVLTVTL